MPKQTIIQIIILSITFIGYLIFTTLYFISLQKEIIFSKRMKIIHCILIWFIPFVWIFLLKGLTKRTPGSYEIEPKEDPKPFLDDGGTMWTG
jgi:hypothetical protein